MNWLSLSFALPLALARARSLSHPFPSPSRPTIFLLQHPVRLRDRSSYLQLAGTDIPLFMCWYTMYVSSILRNSQVQIYYWICVSTLYVSSVLRNSQVQIYYCICVSTLYMCPPYCADCRRFAQGKLTQYASGNIDQTLSKFIDEKPLESFTNDSYGTRIFAPSYYVHIIYHTMYILV